MKVTVWNENIHEKDKPEVLQNYPGGLHTYIAGFLKADDIEVRTATLDEPECGLSEKMLDDTDVLIWWAHVGHPMIPDDIVERVHQHVIGGMGIILLHSAHFSKIFRRLMGTNCTLRWREEARERLWTVLPNHPIAAGVPETFALDCEEMYGEPFEIPNPDDVVFMGWFNGGEVFRSGCTWTRGNGKVFYFQPGHETNTAFQNVHIQRILQNAVRWACPVRKNIPFNCPNAAPVEG